jgi:serine phosphatase RsbU (regulator of sigma subunit)
MIKIKFKENIYLDYFISIFLLTIIISVAILYLFNIYQWRSAPFFGFGHREFSGWAVVGRVYEDGYKAGFRLGDRIQEVNGKPVKNLACMRQLVNKKIGALNHFTVIRNGQKFTIVYSTSKFGLKRAAMVFGISWLIGIIIICIGSFIFYTTLKKEKKWSFFLFCLCAGLIMIFFNQRSLRPNWIHIFGIISFCFLPATILHMTFIFPFFKDYKTKNFIFTLTPYIISTLLLITIKAFSLSFSGSPKNLRIFVLLYLFLSILIFIYMLFYKYRKIPYRVTKLKIRVILFGFFIGVLLPLAEPILNSTLGIFILPNIEMATLPFITAFPLSMAYAIVKHDLFEIDVFIKRTTGYLLATASIALFYLLFVFSANLFLKTIFLRHPHLVNFLFILLVIFLFNPITNNIQIFVNRIFFRQRYDYKEPVKQLLKDITSIFDLDLIIKRVLNILSNTMYIQDIRVFLYNPKYDGYFEYVPKRNTTSNTPDKLISSSSHLVRLLIEEEKELSRDSFYDLPKFAPFGGEMLLLFESWNAQLILPFIMHKRLSGFMVLGKIKSGRYYNKMDLEFLRIIADQTAIALENVNLIQDKIKQEKIEEELKIAGVIQRRMLPDAAPRIKNISIYNQIIPSSEIGGDFYDYIEFPSQREKELGIIIGDISGHGISGALLMSAAHSICHNQVIYLKDVIPVMQAVNTLMIKETKKRAFVAMLYALLLSDGRIIMSNAGLLPPLHYNHHSKEIRFLKNEGERLPIGIVENLSYTPLTISLGKGDVILFYTDGIVEVQNQNKEIFGLPRLKKLFSSLVYLEPEEIYNSIIYSLENFSGKESFDDDLTILILKRTDAPPLDTILSLPSSSRNEGIILQSMESLAQLFSFDDFETTRLKEDANKIYINATRYCKSMSNYKLIFSLFPEGSDMKNNFKDIPEKYKKSQVNLNKNKGRKDRSEKIKMVSDRYCLELTHKDEISNCLDNNCVCRLIVNFF